MIKLCKHNKKYKKIAKYLEEKNIEYKISDCVKACSKCKNNDYFLVFKGKQFIFDKKEEIKDFISKI